MIIRPVKSFPIHVVTRLFSSTHIFLFVPVLYRLLFFFFFNDTATTEISPLPLHDALPILIDIGAGTPSYTAVKANAHALARYAALCQDEGIVPIVEPEVLMDGDHDVDRCYTVSEWMLKEIGRAHV